MKKYFFFFLLLFLIIYAGCKKNDTVDVTVVGCASYSAPSPIFIGDSVNFLNCSENATSYNWDFGDGNSSTEKDPVHVYHTSGNFNVIMTAFGENSSPSKPGTFEKDYDTIMLNFDVHRWTRKN